MKTKLFFFALASMISSFISAQDIKSDETCVLLEDLPPQAIYFLRNDFPNLEEASVTQQPKDNTYEVITSDSCRIVFDNDGKWINVECPYGRIPHFIVPNKIQNEIRKEFGDGTKIVQIERLSRSRYHVVLARKISIKFNKNMEITDVKELFNRS